MTGTLARAARDVGRGIRAAFDVILPQVCVCCARGVEGDRAPVCRLCWHRLPRLAPPWCDRCGATTTAARAPGSSPRTGCAECLEWFGELPRAAAPFSMSGRAVAVVHGLKYGGWRRLARPMARAMSSTAARLVAGRPVSLVPVPLSPSRRRERGFNQARLLAIELESLTGCPVVEAIERLPGGRRQARLGRSDRLSNMRERFRLRDGIPPSVAGPGPADPFLLVDDVLTTGATAAACATVLTESGLRCLGVVTFARAVGSYGD